MNRRAKENAKNPENHVVFDFSKPKYVPEDDYWIWDEEMVANRNRMFWNKISIKKGEQVIEYLDEIIEPIAYDYMDSEVYATEYWERANRYTGKTDNEVVGDLLLENADTQVTATEPKSY